MGGRPAKASDGSGKDSGPNGSEGDAQASASGQQQQPQEQQQQQEPEEVRQLRASVERMESQVAALKEELNKEIEVNAELRTDAVRRQQYDYIALGAALVAAVGALVLFQRRR